MEIEFIELVIEEGNNFKTYQIYDQANNLIGSVEGILNDYGELSTVIRIEEEYQGQGIGKLAFEKVFNELNNLLPITSIRGSWLQDVEFAHLEGGRSVNLTIFLNKKEEGLSDIESAFSTPTGKWSQALGFTTCDFEVNNNQNVTVLFKRADE